MTRKACYADLTIEDVNRLDSIAKRLGYSSRTKFVTSVLHSIVHDKRLKGEPKMTDSIVKATLEVENLRCRFNEILDEYAFPVIAMHGAEYAFKALQPDLQEMMYQRCHAVPQTADMREWLKSYANMKQGEILQYRIARTTERYKEMREEEE